MFGGRGFQRYVRGIERSIPEGPSRAKRRRAGGKRWNIHLRSTPRRRRSSREWISTAALLLSLGAAVLLLSILTFWRSM